MIKTFKAAALALMLGTTSAMAADISAPAAFDWSGGYLGIDFGAALNSSQWSSPTNSYLPFNTNGSGAALGGVLGYRRQMENNVVIGAEVSGDWVGVDGEANCVTFTPTCITKQDFLGLGQVNIGLAQGRAHVYISGGAALGDYHYSEITSLNQAWDGGMRLGWTAGAGFDYAINDKWLAGVRWNYYDFGTQSNGGGISPVVVNFKESGNLITARIEYKF
ncbi:MAG: porin family protein [Alphaproteobacteria bacterium]|nr:porin family protein [Alphaproteobacteria bacterium]